jgi:hypothetical protein
VTLASNVYWGRGPVLRDMGADTVVQLNEARCAASAFPSPGFAHHYLEFSGDLSERLATRPALEFTDCTPPSAARVDASLRAVDAAEGAVARPRTATPRGTGSHRDGDAGVAVTVTRA